MPCSVSCGPYSVRHIATTTISRGRQGAAVIAIRISWPLHSQTALLTNTGISGALRFDYQKDPATHDL
jgi:hypothetical protein